MDFKQMQREHRQWLEANYPNQPPGIPAAGMIEEAAELLHAVLKLEQARIWGEEKRYPLPSLREKLLDAIGDCAIYCCSYCNATGADFATLAEVSLTGSGTLLDMAKSLVMVSETPALYMSRLRAIALAASCPFEATVLAVWQQVKERRRCE